ncbi:MAG: hypothetical protein IPN29_16890 [Saprospiraceae bacterium]|nr:hypothetical protein [Saprospiraceae bacterium]
MADTAQPTLNELTVRILTSIAAIVFMAIGIRYIIKSNQALISDPLPQPSLQKLFFRGLAVNTINPFTFIFWTTLTTGRVIIRKAGVTEQLVFFGSLLAMIMLTDAVKWCCLIGWVRSSTRDT